MSDQKTKIFFWVFLIIILAVIGMTFYRTMVIKDYERIESEEDLLSE